MVGNVMNSEEKSCRQDKYNEVNSDQNKDIPASPKVLSQELDEHLEYEDELARTINRIFKTIEAIKAISCVEQQKAEFDLIQVNPSQFLEKLSTILDQLDNIMVEVIKTHLVKWKEEQRLSANGMQQKIAINIGLIRIWCQEFVSIICHVHEKANILHGLHPTGQNSKYDQTLFDLFKRISNTSVSLITDSVIFVKQPPQILKKHLK